MNEKVDIRNMNNYGINNVILCNDEKWTEKLKEYEKKRDIIKFDTKLFPIKIKEKQLKDIDSYFNPITQKFNNKNLQKQFDNENKINSLNIITNGYDKNLSIESTYNIINLENKLKTLNYNEDDYNYNKKYNKIKNAYDIETRNNKPFNIISNKSLEEHNNINKNLNDIKKLRENYEKSIEGIIPIKKIKNEFENLYTKDYNIINNCYYINNNEKQYIDKEINKAISEKKLKNLKSYNIIQGKYINSDIEKNYQDKLINNKQKKIKLIDKNFIIRNPINNYIYDIKEQNKIDKIEEKKIQRFKVKDELNKYYNSLNYNIENKEKINLKSRFIPFNYKINLNRGYDIITLTEPNIIEKNELMKDYKLKLMNNWEYLNSKTDENNNTLNIKNIYKAPYDTSDINKNYFNFISQRKIKGVNQSCELLNLKNKNKLIDKNDYRINSHKNLCNKRYNNNNISYDISKMNKKKFFSMHKN